MRFACLFSGNGFHSKEFWAKGTGRAMELGKVLQPLENQKEKLLVIRGLYNEQALKGNIHSSQTGNLLSGAPLASGGAIRSGTSIDQVLARRIGRQTKVSSLVLACEPSMAAVHKNYSMLYSSHISWSSPTTPTPLELYPALAFDRLFKDDDQQNDQCVLDASSRRSALTSRPDQSHGPDQARRVLELSTGSRTANRAGRPRTSIARLAPDTLQAEYSPSRRRCSSRHRRTHAINVRYPRARIPDGHHAILHPQTE